MFIGKIAGRELLGCGSKDEVSTTRSETHPYIFQNP
jgi:hypothetical protein